MGGMFDRYFAPIPPSPQARGLDAIGSALESVMKRKEEREMQIAQAEAQMRQRIAADKAAMDREVYQQQQMGERQRQQVEAQRQAAQQKAAQEAQGAWSGAIDQRDPGKARGIAATHGLSMDQQPREQMEVPDAQVDPQAMAQRVATFGFAPDAEAEGRVADDFKAKGNAEFENKRRAFLDIHDPTYRLTMPGGQQVTRSAGEGQQARVERGRALALQLEGMAPAMRGPAGKRALGEQTARANSGAYSETDDLSQDAVNRMGELERIDIMRARKARAVPPGADDRKFGQKTDDARQDRRALMADAKDIMGQYGFKELNASTRKFNDMAVQLANPNAAMDAVSAGTFVKMAQGGTGVISDSDMAQFWGSIGGAEGRGWQWVQKVLNGEIEEDKREIVLTAVRKLADQAGKNMSTVREALEYGLEDGPHKERIIGAFFPEARKKKDAAKPAPAFNGKSLDELDAEVE